MFSKINWRSARSESVFFICFFAVFIVFRTTAFGMYHIPSESMLPTLAVGDRIIVSKFSYGYSRHSIPFSFGPEIDTPTGRLFGRLPSRGDLVVFKHPANGETLIKRVIGLPGETIEIRDGRLVIDGSEIERSLEDSFRYREHLGGVATVASFTEELPGGPAHPIYERSDFYRGDNFGPAQIPENNLFVMGDNRDNSLDSRFPYPGVGFVPVENLVGRAELMVFSLNRQSKEQGLKPLPRRALTPLR